MGKPKLFLFVGYPGAGKTTVSKLIENTTGAIHLWADHERQNMFNTVDHSTGESETLYNYLNERTAQLLAAGESVIFDTNFNYRKDRDHLRNIAAEQGAETVIIWMQTPLAIARARALHDNHRDRNRYQQAMETETFDKLVNHLEPPEAIENFISIDGTDIDTEAVKRQLGI